MIKLVRVDHRLLHGQVAFSWTNGVGADCILVASDMVVNDEVFLFSFGHLTIADISDDSYQWIYL